MALLLFLLQLLAISSVYGTLAGGRPNAFSEGQNAFAGVVNPANAVWVEDRLDIGAFWLYQKSSLNNHDDNPLFQPGKVDLTYKTRNLISVDGAIHKQLHLNNGSKRHDSSITLATYSTPTFLKLRTKKPIPAAGTSPIELYEKISATSLIVSFKINAHHSIGLSTEYFYFSHQRKGFQNSDNPLRSVSPGHVTNNGMDHSGGFGLTLGWRWRITPSLDLGAAWTKKSFCGQYRKYRGFEPHHADNYFPQTFGAGIRYIFNSKFAGRLEVLWINLRDLPGANNNIEPDGSLNLHKRGSDKSPGPGLRDATIVSIGVGYQFNSALSFGMGFSHRIKLKKSSNFLSHTYTLQTIYDILAFGANFKCHKHDIYLITTYGFNNRVSGHLPKEIGGGRFSSEKYHASLSLSWGYLY